VYMKEIMTELQRQLAEEARRDGVDYFGIARLEGTREFILSQGGDYVASFPAAISIGIALPNAVVDLLPKTGDRASRISYRHSAYDVINNRLDLCASKAASSLQRAGHSAFPVPSSERVDDARICASFSHKLAARLCGFGWIGKSCLLVTPDHGPRTRWVTVLTDALLEPTGQPLEERCGDCKKCVDICPVKAFTGRPFKIGEAREARYDAKKCDRYFQAMESRGQRKVCGLCLYVCPFGMA
jgi:epoxyqueuosine reductase